MFLLSWSSCGGRRPLQYASPLSRHFPGASLRAFVENGRGGMVLVVEVERIVVAQFERDVAEDCLVARNLALHLNRYGVAEPVLGQDGASAHIRFDLGSGDPHDRVLLLRSISLADLILGIDADDWKIILRKTGRRHRNAD